ncbi:tRNA 2-thiouridine(34) synthase MnmA [Candidatus Uhrbacteria bacterium]|nr:tRNA 2-thiouridine(34) synthase MnmA [Candidatus Uhrbacteria bacterium]
MIKKKPKVLVGMSGGVDSSVAAALLVQAGYEVIGGFIKNWSDTKDLWTGECAWRGERRDALRVAARLDIPLLTFDFEKEYRKRVLDRMFAEYEQGLTPNPDVLCNEEIKFGLFFEEAMKAGCEFVATGHYARVKRDRTGSAHLLKGADPDKDQSYFLHRVSQKVLRQTLFPIGHLKKARVRKLAEQLKLSTASKPDSQGICFVGKLDFHDFLRKRIKSKPGKIVDEHGAILGQHDGLDAYTIGQRTGLKVSHDQRAWYVVAKDRNKNQLIIVPDREHPLLYQKQATVRGVNWIVPPKKMPCKIDAAIRYRQKPEKARLILCHSSEGGNLRLEFRHPVWALAPGQSAVFYRGTECLGGGFISEQSLH